MTIDRRDFLFTPWVNRGNEYECFVFDRTQASGKIAGAGGSMPFERVSFHASRVKALFGSKKSNAAELCDDALQEAMHRLLKRRRRLVVPA